MHENYPWPGKAVHLRTENSCLVAGAFGDTTCLVEGLVGGIGFAEGNFELDLGHGSEGRSLAAKDHGKDSGLALDDSLIVNVERVRNHFLGVRCLRSR